MNHKTICFPSMASVTLPDGLDAEPEGELLYHFWISKEELKITLLEHQGNLDQAMALAKTVMSISSDEEPITCMSPPEVDFDSTRIEIYGKNKNNQWRQLCGKTQGSYCWVLAFQGEEGVLERRGSQIMSLYQSLKGPEKRKIDFSLMKMESILIKRRELECFIREAMDVAKIPGLALAIIERGNIVYSQGFGKTDILKKKEDILPSTRFMIGSVSKSITTFLIAKLEEEGLLHWKDRAVNLHPDFRLGDIELSSKLSLEDLVCANTGIPRHDLPLVINYANKKAEDLFTSLRDLKQSSGKNEIFQYNNQLVAACGFIATKCAQQKLGTHLSLEEGFASLLKSRVFMPIEMTRSTVDFEAVVQEKGFAYPHSKAYDGTIASVDIEHERFATHIAPAGAIWSTANDMANYAITELNRGLFGSKRILSEERVVYRRQGRISFDNESKYALGWLVGKKKGLDVVHHDGGTFGFSSTLTLFPTIQSGIVILTNSSSGGLALEPIVEKILSMWFHVDLQEKRLLTSNCAAYDSYMNYLKQRTFALSQDLIQRILGSYYHQELGNLNITLEQDGNCYLKKDGNSYRLTGYRENDGNKLMIMDIPFIGFVLEPIFADQMALRIQRGQESYELVKVSS